MKTILPILCLIFLVSCSQPQPKPEFASVPSAQPEFEAAPPAAAPVATNAPAIPAAPVEKPVAAKPSLTQTNALAAAVTNALAKPTPAPPATRTAAAPTPAAPAEQLQPPNSINFQAAPLDQVLTVYSDYVNRTLLRPSALPAVTITLRNQTPLTKKEIIQAMDATLALNGIAMVDVGDKFVKAVPQAQAGQEGGAFSDLNAEQMPDLGSYVTKVVQLTNVDPAKIVQILQPFAKIPGSIVPIEESGVLVLRDYAENVKRMLELIKQVDITIPSEFVSEVIPIKYALASDMATALNSLSSGGGGTTVGSSGSSGHGGIGGVGGVGSLGLSRTAGATGVNQFNRGGYQPQALGNSRGTMGAQQGGSFTDRVRSLIQRASQGGEFQVLGQTKIIADERTNSLLVFASREDMQMIKEVVEKLDTVLPQVLIEAIIMEVSLDNTRSLGVSVANAHSFGGNNVTAGGYNSGQSFLTSILSGTNSFPGALSQNNGVSLWGHFTGNFDVAVQALAGNSRVNVLSTPRIQTSHGVEADLFVGQTIPYVTSTTVGAYGGVGSYSGYEEKQIGLTLKVKPLINPDGLVVMDIYQEASQPGASSTTINGTAVPTINQRQAETTVAVKDRDTIVLGGMISTTQNKTRSGVPYLKDIPLLGNLFRSTSDSEQRTELIVLLRPTVLPTPEAAAEVARKEQDSMPGVRRAQAEIQAQQTARLKQMEKDMGHGDEKAPVAQ